MRLDGEATFLLVSNLFMGDAFCLFMDQLVPLSKSFCFHHQKLMDEVSTNPTGEALFLMVTHLFTDDAYELILTVHQENLL